MTDRTADRLDIAELLSGYSDALSQRDWDAWQSVFTAEATVDYSGAGGVAGTPAQARAWLADTMTAFDLLHYTSSNVRIRFEGHERARVTSAFTGTMRIPAGDGPQVYLRVGGNYDDVVVRTVDGWRIAARTERFGYAF